MTICRRYVTVVAALLTALHSGYCSAGPVYDLSQDFSATSNPTGVWSYGYSASLGAAFNLFGTTSNDSGIDAWTIDGSTPAPTVNHNGTNSAITHGSITWEPGQVGFHPGPNGQNAIVRFTAPEEGRFAFSASFSGLDFQGPTSTDVHVLLNNVSLFDGAVSAFGSGPTFGKILLLHGGDVLDLVVGFGANGTYNFDSTGVQALLRPAPVPEPGSLVLLGTGAMTIFGAIRLRKRKAPNTSRIPD